MSDDYSDNGTSRSWLERVGQFFSSTPGDRSELLDLMRSMRDSHIIDGDTLGIIEGAVCVADMQVREIMIPRSQMVSIKASSDPRDFLPTIIDCAHSRFPVLGDDPDEVIGILLAKDLLPLILQNDSERKRFDLREAIRPAMFIPESKRLNSLLKEFRETRNHMAVVIDEYGGTAGLVTIEDILEQIVGDIEDEHDTDEDEDIRELGDGQFAVSALTTIDDFNEHFDTDFSDEEFDTIGGLMIQRFGHMPRRQESTDFAGWRFTVLNADNRRIRQVQVCRLEDATGDAPPSAEHRAHISGE